MSSAVTECYDSGGVSRDLTDGKIITYVWAGASLPIVIWGNWFETRLDSFFSIDVQLWRLEYEPST